ncbi:glycosyltransferase family 9 protein [Campylobacter fetus]|uniref:glycosyltransferase family 9 protein n=1 Tax=Campylobacter fetus TaxID=196 RepID=UPI000818AE27|nr:glycosyltransferase family 9 protein [Campylobacter fetus]OCR84709.1 hypothetical protein CFT12S05168_08610 [Campylobacter fetus subsp. testudinum]OCS02562.1 hypothetical protein CFTCF782_07975 [Campylobacter fetus subsp. testudinum]
MKILIIKLGYSETFIDDNSRVVSLGDVLRATPIIEALHQKYDDAKISWLTSKEAFTLINGAEFLSETIIYNDKFSGEFDIVINLEKFDEIFELLKRIKSKQIVGFIKENSCLNISPKNDKILKYIKESGSCRVWQELIFDMLGLKWQNQKYNLGYRPKNGILHEVGLNYLVGRKWPTKAMSLIKWNELANMLNKLNINFSWQEGKENLKEYIEWINSCETIITQDSLGMHIAMALDKKVIALFGPTNYMEIYPYGQTDIINIDWSYKNPSMDSLNLQDILNLIKG